MTEIPQNTMEVATESVRQKLRELDDLWGLYKKGPGSRMNGEAAKYVYWTTKHRVAMQGFISIGIFDLPADWEKLLGFEINELDNLESELKSKFGSNTVAGCGLRSNGLVDRIMGWGKYADQEYVDGKRKVVRDKVVGLQSNDGEGMSEETKKMLIGKGTWQEQIQRATVLMDNYYFTYGPGVDLSRSEGEYIRLRLLKTIVIWYAKGLGMGPELVGEIMGKDGDRKSGLELKIERRLSSSALRGIERHISALTQFIKGYRRRPIWLKRSFVNEFLPDLRQEEPKVEKSVPVEIEDEQIDEREILRQIHLARAAEDQRPRATVVRRVNSTADISTGTDPRWLERNWEAVRWSCEDDRIAADINRIIADWGTSSDGRTGFLRGRPRNG